MFKTIILVGAFSLSTTIPLLAQTPNPAMPAKSIYYYPNGASPIALQDLFTNVFQGGSANKAVTGFQTNGSPVFTTLTCGYLSGAAASCSTDATNAANISSGTLALARLPTIPYTQISGLAPSATTDTTNASNISSGTLANGRLQYNSITLNGQGCALGGTCTVAAAAGGSGGQLQVNSGGALSGVPAVNGDATLNTTTGAISVSKTGGVAFSPSATTDTTNASNITSGTLPIARVPTIPSTGVSGLAASATIDTTNASNISSGTLPAARVPAPTSAALGGVKSATAPTNQFQTGIDTSGSPTFAQLGASNLSNGVTGSGSVVLNASPTLTTPSTTQGSIFHDGLTLVGKVSGNFPVYFDNSHDDGPEINAAISALYTAGGGTLYLPPGAANISTTIQLRSFVKVEGSGGTVFTCNISPCVQNVSGAQWLRGSFNHVELSAGSVGNTAISLTSAQYSEVGFITFYGFTSGVCSDIEAVAPTIWDDTSIGPNVIFNSFHDWQMYNSGSNAGCGTPIKIAGAYTSSPPAVGVVVTQNSWTNINAWFTNHCVDIVKAADTNYFYNLLCATHTNGITAIKLADDPSYSTSQVGVSANKFFGLTFSGGTLTSITYFGGNVTSANVAYGINSDVPPSAVTIDGITTSQGNCWYGALDVAGGAFPFENTCTNSSGNGSVAQQDTKTIQSLANGQTYVVPTGTRNLILNNPLIASAVITFPCPARDGDKFSVSVISGGVSSLAYAACSGVNEAGGASSLTSGGEEFQFIGSSQYWVRTQ